MSGKGGVKMSGEIDGKTERKTAEERIQKNNDTVKGQKTQKKGERRQAVRKTRSKPHPNKPVKGRRTLY